MTDATDLPQIPDAELKAAFDGPALASNRFFITVGENGVRLAFTEQWKDGEPPIFRCATIISIQDAIQFRNLLSNMLAPFEQQINSVH